MTRNYYSENEAWYAVRFLPGGTNDIFCKDLYDKYMLFTKSEAWYAGRFLRGACPERSEGISSNNSLVRRNQQPKTRNL